MASTGISGTGVAVATLGGLLVYAGMRGLNPIAALQAVASGKPAAPTGTPIDLGAGSGTSSTAGVGPFGGTTTGNAVVAAAQKYVGDKYSQAKRTVAGYSDCSSFVDKAMLDAGIAPPYDRWANSAGYRMTVTWRTIPESQVLPGDVAVSSHHIVLVTGQGGSSAIGQQNPTVNVRTGTVANLMTGQSYIYRRNPKINVMPLKLPSSQTTGIR
jgi:cell wall-associated NlpC family hydrolase